MRLQKFTDKECSHWFVYIEICDSISIINFKTTFYVSSVQSLKTDATSGEAAHENT
jgi:hypothetical protein